MSKNFYKNDERVEVLDTPLIPDIILKTGLREMTLPTGNQVVESIPLTNWFHSMRERLINHYNIISAEFETQKSAANNELNNVKEYLTANVFKDQYEVHQIPQTNILMLCAYFTGRIMANRKNWGLLRTRSSSLLSNVSAASPSLTARLFTSIPSKIFLPWVLVAYVWNEMMPGSFRNAINCVERDLLPRDFVAQYHGLWNQYYINGLRKYSAEISNTVEDSLRSQIKSLREEVINRTR
ncbi:HCL461Cp [Eremothecium sinecaudum]|uniref:HCL461Cp n=1 Tax=Eremothecium sinecaudum TaxID=45286 RepID=A0A109UW71_9SACH|nr:HCL461Cp [Eremothecium sinecaudum]AMD19690.1 HCL461Cp [Eremothecium sinecaudum]